MGSPSIAQARPTTLNDVGTVNTAVAGITARECGLGIFRQTVLDLVDVPVTVGNTSGASFGSLLLYTLPKGVITFDASTVYFNEIDWAGQDIAVGGSGDFALGTTATADATLSGTDVDVCPSTAMLDPFVAGIGRSNAGGFLAARARFDGSSTAKAVYLNVIVDDADVSDGASDVVLFTGRVVIDWINHGKFDYNS